jgi:hypothetical protein
MVHDFAVYNKPCLYLNYDPVENSSFKVKDVFDFQHFRSMQNLNAVGWINSKEEFQDKIQRAINNPENTGDYRMQWLQKIVKHPLQNNSSTLAKEIITLCTSV